MSDEVGILLAEDTEDMRFLLSAAFAGSRFAVVDVAPDGAQALEAWEREQHRIGAVALDQRMPGLEGLEVARAIRASGSDVPIVLFSAELDRELIAQAEALGCGVLHKDEILQLPHHPTFAGC